MSIRLGSPLEVTHGNLRFTHMGALGEDSFVDTLKASAKTLVGAGVDRVAAELHDVNDSLTQVKVMLILSTLASLVGAAIVYRNR
jgi:hypothetical protein